jgi:uncharacterized spore protein YtfJ
MYKEITTQLKEMVGEDCLYLPEAIEIGMTRIWGLRVSPKAVLWVMDADLEWFPVKEMEDGPVVERIYKAFSKLFKKVA